MLRVRALSEPSIKEVSADNLHIAHCAKGALKKLIKASAKIEILRNNFLVST